MGSADETNEILTESSRFWVEDGILKSRPLCPIVLTVRHVLENLDAMEELAGGRTMPRLAFIDGLLYIERDARELYAGSEQSTALIQAMALVAESHDARVLADFAVKMTAARYPTQVFSDEESAVAWLRAVASED
jgi:hypothetical protein